MTVLLNTKTGEWIEFELPDEIRDAAREVYAWMNEQKHPELMQVYGLKLVSD